jgi:hypothetical protein
MLKREAQVPKDRLNKKMQKLVDWGRWEPPQAEISTNVQEPTCDERARVVVSQQRLGVWLNVREVLKSRTMT